MKQYILFISYEEKILEYTLPGLNDRKILLNLHGKTGIRDLNLSLQVWDEKWYILSNPYVRISQNHMVVDEKELKNEEILNGKVRSTGFRFQIRVGLLDKEQARYRKYDITGRNRIVIGQHESCDFVLNDSYVSQIHAIIFEQNGTWYLQDQSRNGTYLNHQKISRVVALKSGDQIDIIGFRLLFLDGILAVNRISSVTSRLMTVDPERMCSKKIYPERKWFSRAPRFIEPLDQEPIEIEAPPGKSKFKKKPLYLTIGPSLTMPIPIMMTILFQIALSQSTGSSTNPLSYLGMGISVTMFAALGVMWTMLRNRYEEDNKQEEEEARQQSYQLYISQNDQYLQSKENQNRAVLERNYPPVERLVSDLTKDISGLWNRNVNHEDFLTVRVGVGIMKSPNELSVPKQRFSVENDPLVALPGQLLEKYNTINQVAKLVDLTEHKMIGIIGEKQFLYQISHTFLVEACALHSYLDVKLVFLVKKGEWEKQWEWVKWLPHSFHKNKNVRYIVNGDESYEKIAQELMNEIKLRKEQNQEDNKEKKRKFSPHYLVFVSDRELLHNSMLYQHMISAEQIGFTFLLFYGELTLLPNECKYIIEKSNQFSGIYMLNEAIGKSNLVQFERVERENAKQFARMINSQVIQEIGQGEIPQSIDYFSLLGIGRIEQWNLMRHYKENRSFEGMRALIGITSGNKPMYLDIHEKKHGPHGLIAGTTGSGKSETIQTFLLSLALSYHPSEVAFILIDYKGGGMANLFSGIPHVAGMILNLDEEGNEIEVDQNQTRRALLSIRSELKRREKIFNRYKVNHIDAYMRLYRDGKATEPLPHLIIISDEFAELKKEQPEFIKELVSTARVGRSIGVHLILATQKPAGVVDEEIVSNSRFKICLRVQDKTDSMEMLKRPEAAYLSTTGRAYFQLGNNELFEMFQSGYSGALYHPKEEQATADDEDVTMIDLDGSPCVLKTKGKESDEGAITQLEACIRYIKSEALKCHIQSARPLWLPALPKILSFHDVLEQMGKIQGWNYKTRSKDNQIESVLAPIGLIDDPENQSQYPLVLDFSAFSNLLILGNQGCGKSTLIQTMLYALVSAYGPETVNLYVIDLSSGMQKSFLKLPHCGGVAFSEEDEKMKRMIKFLLNTIKERMEIFSQTGVGSFWEYKKVGKKDMPMLFFVIDNYFEFIQNYEELEGDLIQILRSGSKCGIQTIISMNRMSDMRYKLRQNITKILPLELSDKMDYVEALGKSLDHFSVVAKGRGLVKTDRILEFQTALVNNEKTEFERIKKMERELMERKQDCKKTAKKVKVLPENSIYHEFLKMYEQEAGEDRIPLGYERERIEPYFVDLRKTYCYLISSRDQRAGFNLLSNMEEGIRELTCSQYYIHLNPNLSLPTEAMEAVYETEEDIYYMLLLLKEEFTKRNQWKKQQTGTDSSNVMYREIIKQFGRMVFLIDDFGQFLDLVYENKTKEPFYPITELFFKQGAGLGIHFIASMYGGSSANVYRLAFKNFIQEKRGIHLGGHLEQQHLFQFHMSSAQQMKEQPDNVGHFMEEGQEISLLIPWNQEQRRD